MSQTIASRMTDDADTHTYWLLIGIVVLYLACFGILWAAYQYYVQPVFGYAGFAYKPVRVKVIEAMLLITIVATLLPVRYRKPSDVLLHLQFALPIMPMLVLYAAADEPRRFIYFTLAAFSVMTLFAQFVEMPVISLPVVPARVLTLTLVVLAWAFIGAVIALGGMRYFNLDITKVYEYRRSAAAQLPWYFGYFGPMTEKVLLPCALVFAVRLRNGPLLILSAAGSVILFGLLSNKGPLFYPLAVLGLLLLLRNTRHVIPAVVGAFTFIALLGLTVALLTPESLTANLTVRRTYFVPAHLNYEYYDYFADHRYVMWSESKLSFGQITRRFDVDMCELIGGEYYDSFEKHANTGWIGSGYANAGLPGMLGYAIVNGLMLAFVNSRCKQVNRDLVTSIMVVPMLGLFTSADLPTAILTHGVFVAVVVLMFMRDDEAEALPTTRFE